MKNKLVCCILTIVLFIGVLVGCESSNVNKDTEYSVKFNYKYLTFDVVPATQIIKYGNKVTKPEDPIRTGYKFLGWYIDESMSDIWDFEQDVVTKKMVLYAGWEPTIKGEIVDNVEDKDFSSLVTAGSQENAVEYKTFFLPEKDGVRQGYIGDTMPYYEDGVFYIYYLKDEGDSFNHSVYLVKTRDFLTYEEIQEPVLESSREGGQDAWIGTGSVVKVGKKYYFFYTGHNSSQVMEYKEKIMVAESDNLYSFNKIKDYEITPPSDLGQKQDFRDPQAYYNKETNKIEITITAAKSGVARIIKYTVNSDLSNPTYDGVIFSNSVGAFWNLECTDTFKIGDKWYVSYSAQDDTLWYASSDNRYGPYSNPKRMEGKLFYAAKHIEDDNKSYMVGWARRSHSPSSTQDVRAWAGNLVVQEIKAKENGDLYLAPLENLENAFNVRRRLLIDSTFKVVTGNASYNYEDVFNAYERFMIKGKFTFTKNGMFGLAFDYNNRSDKYKMIRFNPSSQSIELTFNEGNVKITEIHQELNVGEEYSFTYIQEGSVGVFYIDGSCAFTVRLYGVLGKPIKLFAENNTVNFIGLCQYTF